MKLVKFLYKKRVYWGRKKEKNIVSLVDSPYNKIRVGRTRFPLRKCKILAPCDPAKIVLVGLNYKDHAKELKMRIPKEPVLFLKPSSAVLNPEETIVYPRGVRRLDYEAELAGVIRKKARNVSPGRATEYILGYTCLNDVTARDLQRKDGQWTRAKSFDTFCPLGPHLETDFNPAHATIEAYRNKKVKQCSSTENFIFPFAFLVSFISRVMTLYPGDVVSSGTPSGVGPMKKGDVIEIKIEGIGTLRNRVGK